MNNNDGVVAEDINRVSPIVPTYGREVLSVFLIGAGVGLLTALAYYLLERFIFSAVLCRDGAAASCGDAPTYATVVAMVIGALVGLVALVQARVYRPLLIVLAAVGTLWGLGSLVDDLEWYWALLIAVLLFGVTYSLYAWVARLRSFVLALIVAITLVVAARVILMS